MTTSHSRVEIAKNYAAAKFSVIPVLGDGSKKPGITWNAYKGEKGKRADDALLEKWFGRNDFPGLALVHGVVSDYSEVLDFDEPTACAEWEQLCADHDFGDVAARLTLRVETPSGGWHIYWRCPDGVEGNLKLAMLPVPVDASLAETMPESERKQKGIRHNAQTGAWFTVGTKIETRGEGGYTIAPGSLPSVHPTGKEYRKVSGSFREVPFITGGERSALLAMARACNQYAEPSPIPTPKREAGNYTSDSGQGQKPGDAFNERGDVLELLTGAGWQVAGTRGDIVDLTRPGKSPRLGNSGTLHAVGPNVFYCFTSSAPPFEYERAYDPFAVFALLKCNGDFKEAARALSKQGYGDPLPARSPDWLDTKTKARLAGSGELSAPSEPGANEEATANGENEEARRKLPVIILTNRFERTIAGEAWDAVDAANRPPTLTFFARGTSIIRINKNADTGRIITEGVEQERMLHFLRGVANFITIRENRDGEKVPVPAKVPPAIARDMLVNTERIGELPTLRTILYAPCVGENGNLLMTHGYHASDQLFLDLGGLDARPASDCSEESARAAFARLFGPEGVFGEFPFASDTDRAHAAALLFSPFLRPYIAGNAPLALVEAPERATGKSILARNLLRVFDPVPASQDAPTARTREDAEAEWSKVLGTALKTSPSTLLFDNLRGTLQSQALESLLTSPDPWSTRLLGTGENVTVWPQLLTMVVTSNNAEMSRDMARRCYTIRLDAGMEQPEKRDGFRIPNLDAYVSAHRGQIVSDVLTIITAWIQIGRPQGHAVNGSFDRWAKVLSGLLDFLGVPGFLEGGEERTAFLDPETARWGVFFALWFAKHKTREMQAKDLLEIAVQAELIGDASQGGAGRSLGKMLAKQRDRVFGGYKLLSHTGQGGIARYRLSPVGSPLAESALAMAPSRAAKTAETDAPYGKDIAAEAVLLCVQAAYKNSLVAGQGIDLVAGRVAWIEGGTATDFWIGQPNGSPFPDSEAWEPIEHPIPMPLGQMHPAAIKEKE